MHTGARARKQKYISIYISLYMKTFLKTGVYIYIYIFIYICLLIVFADQVFIDPTFVGIFVCDLLQSFVVNAFLMLLMVNDFI